ncbi:hypothetical protein ACFQ61_07275 [Streptomyces sp. NPDC056500]|uniref:hypothetical protein n=1 Tax=Streptomyces sp. NPDC056500 TaxID=3345840 RepID=UPI0036A6E537
MRGPLRIGVAALLLTALLTGCGISATDPVEAGDPAAIEVSPGQPGRMFLFFRSPVGALVPVPVIGDTWGEQTPRYMASSKFLAMLFAGPQPEERAAGLRDGLPDLPPGGRIVVVPAEDGGTTVHLPIPLADLDDTAVRQVVCTTAYLVAPDSPGVVRLSSKDGTTEFTTCDADTTAATVAPRPSTMSDELHRKWHTEAPQPN